MRTLALAAVLVSVAARAHADQDLDDLHLPSLAGNVVAVYTPGSEKKAKRLRELVEQGSAFYKDKLGIDTPLRVAVLGRADWEKVAAGVPYGMPFYDGDRTVFMPATNDGVVEKPVLEARNKASKKYLAELSRLNLSYERAAEIGVELIALHELGHAFARAYGINPPTRWLDELLASYFGYAFVQAMRPQEAELQRVTDASGGGLASEASSHTSLDDFEKLYMGVGPRDYVWYQIQFGRQVSEVYKAHGLSFITNLKALFPAYTNEQVLERLDKISPGFSAWGARTFPSRPASQAPAHP
jgi:hypothetical protein